MPPNLAYPPNNSSTPNPPSTIRCRTPMTAVPRFRAVSTFAPDYGYALLASVKRAEQAQAARAAHLQELSIPPSDNLPPSGDTTIFDRVFSGTEALGDANPPSPPTPAAGGAGSEFLTVGGHTFQIPPGNLAERFHAIRTRMVTAFRAVAAGTSTPRDMAIIFGAATVDNTAVLELERAQMGARAVSHDSKEPLTGMAGGQRMHPTHPHHGTGGNAVQGSSATAAGAAGAGYGKNGSVYHDSPATRISVKGLGRKDDALRREVPAASTNLVSPKHDTNSRSGEKGESAPMFSHAHLSGAGKNDRTSSTHSIVLGPTIARISEKIRLKDAADGQVEAGRIRPGVYGALPAAGKTRAGPVTNAWVNSDAATGLTSQTLEGHRSKRARVSARSTTNPVHAGVKHRKQDEEDFPFIPPELRRSSRSRRPSIFSHTPSGSPGAGVWPTRSGKGDHPQASFSNVSDANQDFPVIPPELRRSSRTRRPVAALRATNLSESIINDFSQLRNEDGNYPQGLFFGNFTDFGELFEQTRLSRTAGVEKYMEGLVTVGGKFAAIQTREGDDRCTECIRKGETTTCKVLKRGHENYTNTVRCARCIGTKLKCSLRTERKR